MNVGKPETRKNRIVAWYFLQRGEGCNRLTRLRRSVFLGRWMTLVCCCVAMFFGPHSAAGQLQRDVREVFEGMIEDLDPDIQEKFKEALRENSASVELTPDQFRRFRRDPANPFEGLGHIRADNPRENIVLKFELPSMRGREVSPLERQSKSILRRIAPPQSTVANSTVRIIGDQEQVAMGIVIRSDGLVLTKASEVESQSRIRCLLASGEQVDATILVTNRQNDLALLKIEADDLTPVRWSNKRVLPGTFVVTPDIDGSVIALGTYSVSPRSTIVGEQAFLGVQPQTTNLGVRIGDIRPGTASFQAGLKNGDVVTRFGNNRIFDVAGLVNSIRGRRPGDLVEIEFIRGGTRGKVIATLAGRNVSGERAARFKMMNRLGAVPSRRDGNFPNVFQHDSPLFPEQCGGPITDLDGNVLGINIARRGRAATYAIPASHVQTLLEELLKNQPAPSAASASTGYLN